MTTLTTAEDGRTLLPTRPTAPAAVMAEDPTPAPVAQAAAAAPMGQVDPIDLEGLAQRVAALLSEGPAQSGALSRFASFGAFVDAVRGGDSSALAAFADQLTENNPGVIPPAWLQDVKGIVDVGARAIAALGGPASIGDAGMALDWPYFDGDLSTLVGEQVTQLTGVTSVRVDLKQGTTPLHTYAGGSTIAWQLIQRSSPAYMAAYLRIMAAAYAVVTDKAFATALHTGATAGDTIDFDGAGTTAAQIRNAIFDASDAVDNATGAPATCVLAAPDVFRAIGSKDGLGTPAYGVQNVPGVAQASDLRVDVSGLPVIKVKGVPLGFAIVTNPIAARWHGTGPLPASADEVLKLGRDQVLWGMGATALYTDAGVIKLGAAPAADDDAKAAKK